MTSFSLVPVKKVTIHQIVKISLDEFKKRRALEGSATKWAAGVLILTIEAPDNIETVREELTGILHWMYVEVAECKEFTSLKHDGVELPVFDVSTNPLYVEFADLVKTQQFWGEQK